MRDIFLIAEVGVNHNGSLDMAVKMAREAVACGAHCVKFQTFKAERVASAAAPKARYQLETTASSESQLAMLKSLELPDEAWAGLMAACAEAGAMFLSTPYGPEDADFLERLGIEAFKIASGQVVEPTFLRHVARKGRPVILSTGMATLAEVDQAVRTLREANPVYWENQGAPLPPLTVLQCTTDYPSRIEDANLRAMPALGAALQVPVGYSDHTPDEIAAVAAVALGATIVEKHFTLDKTLPGPDHAASADPAEFRRLAAAVRQAALALGHGRKEPCARERENLPNMRRGCVAARDLAAGMVLGAGDVAFRRPLQGVPAAQVDLLLGRTLRQDVGQGQFLDLSIVGLG
jgi:N-acetylneuraminate synthase/N,N'-diacetyllegionaminate synthase